MILVAFHQFRRLAVGIFLCLIWLAPASAQTTHAGCLLQQSAGTSRQTLVCGTVTIVVERGARYKLSDRNSDGTADSVVLRHKALLLDAPAGAGGFEVITPQAIAAVRGTKWAVDVAGRKTSVFVVTGRVDVRRPAVGRGVVLRSGEGVDVEQGTAPLTVKRWGAPRVAALMARFGQ
ncbi:MAG: FecR domain-containing protein [Mesorhizobium sp.]|jgi:ferric-dicitrate binding protein FerR (iron transport regulator)|nr:FecR domain-containing protein [Mesorhizobium sp.]